MTFLLDTDTFILLLRGSRLKAPRREKEKRLRKMAENIRSHCQERTREGHTIGLSAISLAELEFGLIHGTENENRRRALHKTLLPFASFPFDPIECVRHYGIIRSALEKKGTPIGPLDTLIAAHALALDATLVTHNRREFKHVPGLPHTDWA